MVNQHWGKIASEYKKSKDKTKFFREEAAEIVRAEAEKIEGDKSMREKLGLMTTEGIKKAGRYEVFVLFLCFRCSEVRN